VNNYNSTTINNYCIGYRPIPIELKKIYSDLYDKYNNDRLAYLDIILSILSIVDNKIYPKDDNSLNQINENVKLKKIINEIIIIIKKDKNIEKEFISKINKLNNYEAFIHILNYSILNNIQPVYTQDINIKINNDELNDYLKVKLYYGQSNISSLMMLSNKNNMYACAELGSLEFDGLISGEKNYDKSYEYYMRAALKNHPKACWMVANLMLSGKVKMNFDIMWKYLYKSIELGSAAGYNTLGLLYKKGINKENKVDLEKAKEYFLISSEMGYVYAFNNLGKLYEDEGNVEEAIKYYKISADMMESWALNKVGEYYRKKGDYKTAFIYYSKSIEAPINEKNNYAYYNLAKYYYENGNICANIKVDSKKAECYYKLSGIKK
jgi:TPR repeat protein